MSVTKTVEYRFMPLRKRQRATVQMRIKILTLLTVTCMLQHSMFARSSVEENLVSINFGGDYNGNGSEEFALSFANDEELSRWNPNYWAGSCTNHMNMFYVNSVLPDGLDGQTLIFGPFDPGEYAYIELAFSDAQYIR